MMPPTPLRSHARRLALIFPAALIFALAWSAPAEAGSQWTCKATCPVKVRAKGASCPGTVQGEGSRTTEQYAKLAARNEATRQLPKGCQMLPKECTYSCTSKSDGKAKKPKKKDSKKKGPGGTEHTKNKNKKEKHEKGQGRKKKDKDGEKGDARRKYRR